MLHIHSLILLLYNGRRGRKARRKNDEETKDEIVENCIEMDGKDTDESKLKRNPSLSAKPQMADEEEEVEEEEKKDDVNKDEDMDVLNNGEEEMEESAEEE